MVTNPSYWLLPFITTVGLIPLVDYGWLLHDITVIIRHYLKRWSFLSLILLVHEIIAGYFR